MLIAAQLHRPANVPPTLTWFAKINNPQARRVYIHELQEYLAFSRITAPNQLRIVIRAHLFVWRCDPGMRTGRRHH